MKNIMTTAGVVVDRGDICHAFTIPVYGITLDGFSVLLEEHHVRVVTEYEPIGDNYDVFFFEECVVYNTSTGIIVVRDEK